MRKGGGGAMSKRKGTRIEHKARHLLEAAGYTVQRTAGSLGCFDLLAWLPDGPVRALQIKGGKAPYCAPAEREAITEAALPAGATREIWYWKDYARVPEVRPVAGRA